MSTRARARGAAGREARRRWGARASAWARDFAMFYLLLAGLLVLFTVGRLLRGLDRRWGTRATEGLAGLFERVGGA